MDQTISLPLWLFFLILLFAAVTFATHFLNPTVRWFFRSRTERAVEQLNQKLVVPIRPFKLARRHDTILRLIYDPAVTRAVADHAQETGLREDAAFALAQKYAREIVPSFSANAYFGFAIRAARMLSNGLYDVRLEEGREDALRGIDPEATVVFVMNHRSNMDYVLVTWLARDRSALSYAVGEWARIWPLSGLIRAMGAYFIRRQSTGMLYRTVLARYVQMATEAGVSQAMFPEGGLSLNGQVGTAKKGLLSYIVEGTERSVVFVPVALNYDQVLEDRMLLRAGALGKRRFKHSLWRNGAKILGWIARRTVGRGHRFGRAAVAFGAPLALADLQAGAPERRVSALADALMARLRAAVPVLPVPLVCLALTRERALSEAALREAVERLAARCAAVPGLMVQSDVDAALSLLRRREVIRGASDRIEVMPGQDGIIAYYAASIAHHLDDHAALHESPAAGATAET